MKDFDKGLRPSHVRRRGLKKATIYRYFQEWKKKNLLISQKKPSFSELIEKIKSFTK